MKGHREVFAITIQYFMSLAISTIYPVDVYLHNYVISIEPSQSNTKMKFYSTTSLMSTLHSCDSWNRITAGLYIT